MLKREGALALGSLHADWNAPHWSSQARSHMSASSLDIMTMTAIDYTRLSYTNETPEHEPILVRSIIEESVTCCLLILTFECSNINVVSHIERFEDRGPT